MSVAVIDRTLNLEARDVVAQRKQASRRNACGMRSAGSDWAKHFPRSAIVARFAGSRRSDRIERPATDDQTRAAFKHHGNNGAAVNLSLPAKGDVTFTRSPPGRRGGLNN